MTEKGLDGTNRLVIFGAGSYAELWLPQLTMPVAYFVDNDSAKWSQSYHGRSIRSPESLRHEVKEGLLVAIASTYYDEIASQLTGMGLEEDTHYFRISGLARFVQEFPQGHYYSPLPDEREVEHRREKWFDVSHKPIPGIDLGDERQVAWLKTFASYDSEFPFPAKPTDGLRYYYENQYFSSTDAIMLYSFMRTLRPRRIVEVGSGFSSAVMLDTNDLFMDGSVQCTFIEPYPDRLRTLLRPSDADRTTLYEQPVQDVDISVFAELEANDILFIDSSHVSKIGSDVNHLLFEVLPALKDGVFVHIHDIFWPFDYSQEWIRRGRHWSEAYLLRAFLQHNDRFRIELWIHYLHLFHHQALLSQLPASGGYSGGSLWLRKSAARGQEEAK